LIGLPLGGVGVCIVWLLIAQVEARVLGGDEGFLLQATASLLLFLGRWHDVANLFGSYRTRF
jgi:hypothetical protein